MNLLNIFKPKQTTRTPEELANDYTKLYNDVLEMKYDTRKRKALLRQMRNNPHFIFDKDTRQFKTI